MTWWVKVYQWCVFGICRTGGLICNKIMSSRHIPKTQYFYWFSAFSFVKILKIHVRGEHFENKSCECCQKKKRRRSEVCNCRHWSKARCAILCNSCNFQKMACCNLCAVDICPTYTRHIPFCVTVITLARLDALFSVTVAISRRWHVAMSVTVVTFARLDALFFVTVATFTKRR